MAECMKKAPSPPIFAGIGRNLLVAVEEPPRNSSAVIDWESGEAVANIPIMSQSGNLFLACFPKDLPVNSTLSFRTKLIPSDQLQSRNSLLSNNNLLISEARTWSTSILAPRPDSKKKQSDDLRLVLQTPSDEEGLLRETSICRSFLEARYAEKLIWQRLSGCTQLSRTTVSVKGMPADAHCDILARYAIDLRPMGASTFYWDLSAQLPLETVPLPPHFECQFTQDKMPSFVLQWRAGRRRQQKTRIQVFDSFTHNYLNVYSGRDCAVDLCHTRLTQHEKHFPIPGACYCARIVLADEYSCSAPCVIPSPLPPLIQLKNDQVHIVWDGALDTSRLPSQLTPLPYVTSLQVARLGNTKTRFQTIASARNTATASITTTLESGAHYQFRVEILTKYGTSTSEGIDVTRDATLPDPPERPRLHTEFFVAATGRRSPYIRVDWSRPLRNGGSPIENYLVQVKRGPSAPWTDMYSGPQTSCADDDTLGAEILFTALENESLTLESTYRVKAASRLGWSAWSTTVNHTSPSQAESGFHEKQHDDTVKNKGLIEIASSEGDLCFQSDPKLLLAEMTSSQDKVFYEQKKAEEAEAVDDTAHWPLMYAKKKTAATEIDTLLLREAMAPFSLSAWALYTALDRASTELGSMSQAVDLSSVTPILVPPTTTLPNTT